MREEIISEFYRENEKLIAEAQGTEAHSYLEGIHRFYEKDPYQYAEVQLGLTKALDFLLGAGSQIRNLSITVVTLAYHLLQIYSSSCIQSHEDGACIYGFRKYFRMTSNLTFDIWPELHFTDALCFNGKIDPCTLPRGTTIYRLIGTKTGNKKSGNWWLEKKPTDRKNWRSGSAVSEQWNDGNQILEITLDKELRVWRGITGSQAVPKSPVKCYLEGGQFQLWLEPDEIQPSLQNVRALSFP